MQPSILIVLDDQSKEIW